MNFTLTTEMIIIILAIFVAVVTTCCITQKDTWEGIGEHLRKIVYIVIALVFIGGIGFLVYALCNQLTV